MARRGETDYRMLMARLSDSTSIWLRHEVGGLLWLARVSHDRDGSFSVGPWSLLPGGWEHTYTFEWGSLDTEVSYIGGLEIIPLDPERALLFFSRYSDENWAMVVRADPDGSFSSGEPLRFYAGNSSHDLPMESGNLADGAFWHQLGQNRVIVKYYELYRVGIDPAAQTRYRIFTAAGLDLNVSVAYNYGPPAVGHGAGTPANWESAGGTEGWWDFTSRTESGQFISSLTWISESGGSVTEYGTFDFHSRPTGTGYALDWIIHYLEPGWYVIEGAMRLSTSQFPLFFRLIQVVNNQPTLVGQYNTTNYYATYAYNTNPSEWGLWFAPMSRRNAVDFYYTVSGNTAIVRYRDFVFAGTAATNPHVAEFHYPPDENAAIRTRVGKVWRLSSSRAMGMSVASWYVPDPQDSGHNLYGDTMEFLRLVTFNVPPVCPPPPEPAEVAGTPLIRVHQGAEVVRTVPPTALATTYERTPCGQVEGAVGNKGPVRVYPVGRR